MSAGKPVLGYSYDVATGKARRYCAYQERSQQEVRDKLYQFGLHRKEVEQAIAQLIEEGYLNEQRFASAFAGGRFRMKQWGKIRIELALKEKKVSPVCIRHALADIDDREYRKTLEQVLKKRSRQVPERDERKKRYKLAQYAISKGYEPVLVWQLLGGDDYL